MEDGWRVERVETEERAEGVERVEDGEGGGWREKGGG